MTSFVPLHERALEELSSVISDRDSKVSFLLPNQDVLETKKIRDKMKCLLDSSKWIKILEEFNEVPEKYRKYIWTSFLQLPRNFSKFYSLLNEKNQNHFPNVQLLFPGVPHSLLESLNQSLNCLCIWTPMLASVDILPNIIFPFFELFEDNPLLCFEVSVTLISNWFRLWIEQWPNTPVFLLNIIDQMICDSDPELWLHFQNIKATPVHFSYPLIFTSLSKILCKTEWYKVWDHVLSKSPSFLLCVIAAIVLLLRESLLLCKESKQIKIILYQESGLHVKEVLKKSKRLFSTLKLDLSERERIDFLVFIPKGDLIPLNLKIGNCEMEESSAHEICHHLNLYKDENELRSAFKSSLNMDKASSTKKCSSRCYYSGTKLGRQRHTEMTFLNQEEVLKRSDECLKRISNIRKKQLIRYT